MKSPKMSRNNWREKKTLSRKADIILLNNNIIYMVNITYMVILLTQYTDLP